MSFAESIILPLSVFKKLKFEGQRDNVKFESVLNNPALSSSEKMLLLEQDKLMRPKLLGPEDQNPSSPPSPADPSSSKFAADVDILRNIETKFHPQVKSILERISRHSDVIDWVKDTLEVRLHGKTIFGSNIIDILKAMTNNAVVTKDSDLPAGTRAVYTVLVDELNLPKVWIPATFPYRESARLKIKKKQSGHGQGWFCY